jgi:hypothetical protein
MGPQGETGQQGLNLYETYIYNGGTATWEAFVESLKGDKGEQGEEGPAGKDGMNALAITSSYEKVSPTNAPWIEQTWPNSTTTNIHFALPLGVQGEKGDAGESAYDV